MKAHVISSFGDHSVFETIDVAKPTIKPGHVLIRVQATSVNPIDTKLRSGRFPQITADFPAILHCDVAGTVVEVADDVTDYTVGDEVFGCAGGLKGEGGALAEYMLVDANLIAKKPTSLTLMQAAALPLVAITAWEGLIEKIKILPEQKVLVHAGTGGVGHVAIQLAKWLGADVFATVSSPEKAALAKSLGAKETINYKKESVENYVNRLTDGKGFDVVFDSVGGENIDRSFQAVAMYGNVITILAQSTHDLSLLHTKSANLHVVFMLLPLLCHVQRKRHGEILKQIAKLVDDKCLQPLIDPNHFTFENIGKAHALLESGKAIGKIVVEQK